MEREAVNKDGSSLIIAGMALSEPGKKFSGLAKDKIENDMSATALGYVGHVSNCALLDELFFSWSAHCASHVCFNLKLILKI